MTKVKIWANSIVNNEENFVWFSIMSVIDYVDKVLVYDSGSTDKTTEIIHYIEQKYKDKIKFKEVGTVNEDNFAEMRQKMLDESNCDWILILDGDEIWWQDSIKQLIQTIKEKGDQIDAVVVPFVIPVGDIYHIQEEEAGQYNLLGKKGHLSLRAFSKVIPGLHAGLPYGRESFFDQENRLIQDREGVIFLNAPYLHATHLIRSSVKRAYNKFKFELGKHIPKGFKYPEVFLQSTPEIVPSPWVKITGLKKIKAQILTPLRKIKRRMM